MFTATLGKLRPIGISGWGTHCLRGRFRGWEKIIEIGYHKFLPIDLDVSFERERVRLRGAYVAFRFSPLPFKNESEGGSSELLHYEQP